MSTDDDERVTDDRTVVLHPGEKVVTVGQRFDRIEKWLMVLTGLFGALVAVHVPEIQPYVETIVKVLK